MNRFSIDQMEMLTAAGYQGAFIQDIKEGDQIALRLFGGDAGHEDEPEIVFVTVERLVRVPRFERDDFGRRLSTFPNYLMEFLGVHESGLREPMSIGAGWAVFIKERE